MDPITILSADPERWEDVVTVMGTRGDPAHCWCQFFRFGGAEWRSSTRDVNRRRLREQVEGDRLPPGVLAYRDGEPVGWCAVAPKPAYPRLLRSPVARTPQGEGSAAAWAVTCFVVRPVARRQGVGEALLQGAIELARSRGADSVEAYPVDPAVRRSVSSDELFHGTVSMFRRAGFTELRRPYPARAVMQLPLPGPAH